MSARRLIQLVAVAAGLIGPVSFMSAVAQPLSPDLSSCNAAHLRSFIGKTYAQLQRIRPGKARYVCRGCPMTMDFRADRLTVVYHPKTKRIIELRCV